MRKLILLLLFIPLVSISAQNLSGSWGYRINGKQITIYGDKIENQNNGGRTGTLKIAIYGTSYPYSGGYLNGYLLLNDGDSIQIICFIIGGIGMGYNDWKIFFSKIK